MVTLYEIMEYLKDKRVITENDIRRDFPAEFEIVKSTMDVLVDTGRYRRTGDSTYELVEEGNKPSKARDTIKDIKSYIMNFDEESDGDDEDSDELFAGVDFSDEEDISDLINCCRKENAAEETPTIDADVFIAELKRKQPLLSERTYKEILSYLKKRYKFFDNKSVTFGMNLDVNYPDKTKLVFALRYDESGCSITDNGGTIAYLKKAYPYNTVIEALDELLPASIFKVANNEIGIKVYDVSNVERKIFRLMRTIDIIVSIKDLSAVLCRQDEMTHIDELVAEADIAMIVQAMQIIYDNKRVSISMLQRYLGLGFPRAGRIVDTLERCELISHARMDSDRRIYYSQKLIDAIRDKIGQSK